MTFSSYLKTKDVTNSNKYITSYYKTLKKDINTQENIKEDIFNTLKQYYQYDTEIMSFIKFNIEENISKFINQLNYNENEKTYIINYVDYIKKL